MRECGCTLRALRANLASIIASLCYNKNVGGLSHYHVLGQHTTMYVYAVVQSSMHLSSSLLAMPLMHGASVHYVV
jgi:hypothetical protein